MIQSPAPDKLELMVRITSTKLVLLPVPESGWAELIVEIYSSDHILLNQNHICAQPFWYRECAVKVVLLLLLYTGAPQGCSETASCRNVVWPSSHCPKSLGIS